MKDFLEAVKKEACKKPGEWLLALVWVLFMFMVVGLAVFASLTSKI